MKIKYLKLIMSLILLLCVTVSCGTKEEPVSETKNSNGEQKIDEDVSAYFIEEEMMLPENVINISDICFMDNGVLCLAGSNLTGDTDSIGGIWESEDNGNTWNLLYDYKTIFKDAIDGQIETIDVRLSPTKDAIISVGAHTSDDTEIYKYYTMTLESNEIVEIPSLLSIVNDNRLQFVDYLNGKTFFGNDMFGQAYVIDLEKNSVTTLLSDEEQMQSYEYTDSTLFILTNKTMKAFDLSSLKQVETKNNFDTFLSGFTMEQSTNGTGFALIMTDDGEKIYYSNKLGIFSFDGKNTKKLVDGSKTIFTNETIRQQEILTLSDEEILACIQANEGTKLYRYSKADEAQEISEELDIYTLYENKNINQAANLYQKKNGNIKVTIETGMKGNNISISDAIKALNVKMAGGNGPDIIVLDGLNIDNFIKQDLLCDINDIVQETNRENVLFSQISKTYFEDGKLFAVPTRFSAMMIAMNKNDNDTIQTIEDFVANIENLAASNPQSSVIDPWSYNQIVSILYRCCLDDIVNGNAVNEENLTGFYESIEKLYQMNDMSEVSKMEEKKMIYINMIPSSFGSIDLVASNQNQIALDYAVNFLDFVTNHVAKEVADITVEPLKLNEHSYYVPQTVLGINSASTKIDTAKDFIKASLTQEVQESYRIEGLPINKNAFISDLSSMKETEINFENDSNAQVSGIFKPFDNSQIDEYITQIETLEKASNMDHLLMEIIMEQADHILDGSMQIDEAVNNASSKLSLYLSE